MGRVWVLPGCQHSDVLSFESCSSPVGKSPWKGKAVRGLWPWSLRQTGLQGPPCPASSRAHVGAQPRRGSPSAAIALGGHQTLGQGLGALPSILDSQWALCQQQQDQQRGCHMETTLWRGCSCWITHLSVLFPTASPDYRVTMSLSQGTTLFCVFLLPTKRQMTLPPWLAGAADADEKTAERT